MKLSLSLKFVITYIVLGIVGFVLLNTEGIRILDRYVVNNESSRMYTSAVSLSSTKAIRSYQNEENLESAYEMLQAVAATEQVDIMIIDRQGQLVLDTSTPLAARSLQSYTGRPGKAAGAYCEILSCRTDSFLSAAGAAASDRSPSAEKNH